MVDVLPRAMAVATPTPQQIVSLMNITELEVSNPVPVKESVAVSKDTSFVVGKRKKPITVEAMYPSRTIREKGSQVWDYSGCGSPVSLARMDGRSSIER